jgi:vitamin B12 transporter
MLFNPRFFIAFILLCALPVAAQTTISGTVVSQKKETIPGANIILVDTYDGTTSDLDGNFSFTTYETGKLLLQVSFLGFDNFTDTIELPSAPITLNIELKESFNELKAVVISAGSFEASDEKRGTILRPLDIVTTAGASGDIYGALTTLPGATQVGNDDGFYVRGGSDYETMTIIDGVPVQNPFFSTVPDLPSRGRFAPFLFKGTVFSTGGYSAEYGQALSSAIILNTEDMPEQTSSGVSLSPIFAGVFHTQKWKNTALGGGIDYTNLALFNALFEPQTYDNIRDVQALSGNIFFRQKTSQTGILKVYGQFEGSGLGVRFPDVDSLAENVTDDIFIFNRYNYVNVSYREILGKKWTLNLASGYSTNADSITVDGFYVGRGDKALQFKATITNQVSEKLRIKVGSETWNLNFHQFAGTQRYDVDYNFVGSFVEADIFITNDLAGRIGVRHEYTDILQEHSIAPRASLAYKLGENSQVGLAYGDFYQTPQRDYLFNPTQTGNLIYEKATHYIANYQVINNDRTFRVEVYQKEYDDLITYEPTGFQGVYGQVSNDGYGYARGIDVFFRDKKTIENADYWISYSYLDTKRQFLNYPVETQPTFAADHVLSVVYKHYISKMRTQFGATYRYISGWPVYNPYAAEDAFLEEISPVYQDLSVNASYLTQIAGNFTVIFAAVNNVLGMNQVFGRTYSVEDPGVYVDQKPPLVTSIFVGMFVNISKQ